MPKLRKKNGYYNARFYDKHRDPPRTEVSLGTSRKSVAEPRMDTREEEWAKGNYDPWEDEWSVENKKLSNAGAAFIEAKEKEGRRPNTIETYRYKLKGLREHTPPGVMVRDVLPDHIEAYIHAAKEVDGEEEEVANRTKRHRHSHLATFFRWAVNQGWTDENPLEEVEKPRKEEKKKAFLEWEEVEEVLNAIDAYRRAREGKPGPTPSDEWMKGIIVVAFGTGLRRGELLNLEWQDIDLKRDLLYVCHREGFKPKNGQERAVKLVGEAKVMLTEMNESRDPERTETVFIDNHGESPPPIRVTKRFKRYVRKAELPESEKLHFHSLRHSTASHLKMNGASDKAISDVLGQKDTRMAKQYSHLSEGVADRRMKETFGAE